MRSPNRSLGSIKTMHSIADGRKKRTPATALLSLSALSYEKELLSRELERWHRRHAEIVKRLREIEAREVDLRAVAQLPIVPPNLLLGVSPAANTTEFTY